ncbi:MAG: hypothetical protein AAGD06_17855 [Acidobacteriota bacterium]
MGGGRRRIVQTAVPGALGLAVLLMLGCAADPQGDSPGSTTQDPAVAPTAEEAPWDPPAARRLAHSSWGKCAEGDVEGCRDGLRRALELRPGHVEYLQLLAEAEAKAGNVDGALDALSRIAAQTSDLTLPEADVLTALVADPGYVDAMAALEAFEEPIGVAEAAFRFPGEADAVPEGLALDPATGDVYLGSIHRRKILRRAADGTVSDFAAEGEHGLWAVFGLAVDPETRRLWAVTSTIPNMRGFDESAGERAALIAFDLEDGSVAERHAPEGDHRFSDLTLGPDGTIYVSDNVAKHLWHLPKGGALEPFGDPEGVQNPQGLAVSADGRHLFAADYGYGLVAFDVATGKSSFIRDLTGFSTEGIDGLARHGDALYAVQNGLIPARVTRFELSEDLSRVESAEVLHRGLPEYEEPTLCTVSGDVLYYVATSQWNRFDDFAKLPPAEDLVDPLILKIDL